MELKILGKIDLPDREKAHTNPEKYIDFLKNGLLHMEKGINDKYGNILDKDGILTMEGDDVNYHQEIINIKENVWAKENGLSLSNWKEKREKNTASIAEMATVVLLDKFFGDRFLVARASAYDDYENGVDNVLLDKETGAVICGFDQVVAMNGGDGSSKKEDKMRRILLKGGTKLEYGIALDDDKKIKREKLNHIPAFFLAINKGDLLSLLEELKDNKVSNGTKKVLKNILLSVSDQYLSAQKLLDENSDDFRYQKLVNNLEKFKESFAVIKERTENLILV